MKSTALKQTLKSGKTHQGSGSHILLATLLICIACGDKPATNGNGNDEAAQIALEMEQLSSDDAEARATALERLAGFDGDGAKEAAPRAVELLSDPATAVKMGAIQVIQKFKYNTPESVGTLEKLAKEGEDPGVKENALFTLSYIGANEQFVAICREHLASGDPDRMCVGANGLARGGEAAAKAAQAEIIAGLESKDPCVRGQCAVAVGNLGADAPPEAKSAVQKLTKDKDESVAENAKAAMENLE
tara:strand:+ start:627 stop:1364 length:738 start_codon:yes stop_codon:yes gene_type:complete